MIEKLKGRSYNHIIAIDTPTSNTADLTQSRYILRIPRFTFA